jgi:hypothetical protein
MNIRWCCPIWNRSKLRLPPGRLPDFGLRHHPLRNGEEARECGKLPTIMVRTADRRCEAVPVQTVPPPAAADRHAKNSRSAFPAPKISSTRHRRRLCLTRWPFETVIAQIPVLARRVYRVDARADRVAGRPPNQHAHHHKNEAAAPRTIAIIARFFSRVIDQAIAINLYYLLYAYQVGSLIARPLRASLSRGAGTTSATAALLPIRFRRLSLDKNTYKALRLPI